MKLSMAAAAIAFSGTALFFAPTAASAAQQDMKPQATAKSGWDGGDTVKAGWDGAKAGATAKGGLTTAKLETEYDGMGGVFEEASMSGETGDLGAKLAGGEPGKLGVDNMDMGAKLQTASLDMGDKGNMAGKGDVAGDVASGKQAFDAGQTIDTAAVTKEPIPGAVTGEGKPAYAGMGGPEEAATDYPACRPGPGDDRCIQLYEVGGSAKA